MFRLLTKSKIAFILAILFGISLFFFRSGSRYSNFLNSDSIIAKVSDTKISTTKFTRTMDLNINKLNLQGKDKNDGIRNYQIFSLANEILSSLIKEALFENEYDKIKLKVDEKVIALNTKKRVPQLYDSNNQLNKEYLNDFLKQQRLTIKDLVHIIEFETRDKYFNDAFFNTKYPEYFSKKINKYDEHTREISYIAVDIENILIDKFLKDNFPNISEELKKYYEKNIKNYMSKEKRNVEFFTINKNALNENFQPTDFAIKEYYNNNNELFYQNEKRSFIQFNFQEISEADIFLNKIKDFDKSKILEYSKNNNIKYNEFKSLQENEILSSLSEELFKLKINEKSKIIETSLAKHILILTDILPAYQSDLNEVRNEIKDIIAKVETQNFYNDLLNQISKKIIDGNSFKSIANSLNLDIRLVNDLTRDYKEYDESEKILYLNLIESSFASNKDFVSDIIKINENLSYVFNVINIDESVALNFEDIKDDILDDLKNSKRIEITKKEIDENTDNSNFIYDIAIRYNLPIEKKILNANSKELPLNLTKKIFETNLNENTYSITNRKFYISKIEEILIEESTNLNNNIFLADNLRDAFGQELMKTKKISPNEELISAIIQQY
ncbi:MAG: peptidylprolyl isomerase [Alphaproteobacteria bacterium]